MRTATLVLSAFLALYLAVLGAMIGAKNGFVYDEQGRPAITDYIGLWAAGRMALEGRAEKMYDWDAHDAERARGLGRTPEAFSPLAYPPTFMLVMAPFAVLGYLPSYLMFGVVTLALYCAVNAAILGRWQGAIWMSTPIATLLCFWIGQNGLLNAALIGAGLIVLPRRPVMAGVAFGLLSYKPHLAMLIPFALAAGGHWRAFAAAAATAVAFALAALLLFGLESWVAALDGMARVGQFMLHTYPTPEHLQSLFGALRTLGVPVPVALGAQSVLTVAAIGVVVVVWSSPAPYRLKAAALAAAAMLPSPYLYLYDMTVLAIAEAFLLAQILPAEPDRTDIYAIALANFAMALALSVAFPMAVFAAPLLLAAIAWRMRPQLRLGLSLLRGMALSA